jgi:hypothetical protein
MFFLKIIFKIRSKVKKRSKVIKRRYEQVVSKRRSKSRHWRGSNLKGENPANGLIVGPAVY